jgi:glutamyl/glutaminyl-tRNA synthetase
VDTFLTMPSYIGRLAPSPTGLLHLGHAYAFWAAAERARIAEGQLLLRIDDLDRERSKEQFVAATLADLAWLGISWEPPPVRQSDRMALYREALERLIAQGLAYPCTCSRKDLELAATAPHEEDDEPIYNGLCRSSRSEGFSSGVNYRLRTPDGERILVHDGNLGERAFICGQDFGDFLLWRKDGMPSYQLATVVDDAEMGVTEVVRGRDLLKSSGRQMLVARGLGVESPAWLHVELVPDESGVRLAKRHDALSIRALRELGMTRADVLAMALKQVTSVTSDC